MNRGFPIVINEYFSIVINCFDNVFVSSGYFGNVSLVQIKRLIFEMDCVGTAMSNVNAINKQGDYKTQLRIC